MFSLSWDVEELKALNEEGRKLRVEISSLVDICTPRNFQPMNVPRKLTSIRQRLCELIKRVTKFKRNAATHVFVFMISSELRDRKPFAIPIQCIPYKGLGEENIRTLTRAVITEMVAHGMKISGIIPAAMCICI